MWFEFTQNSVQAAYDFDNESAPLSGANAWEDWQTVVNEMHDENLGILACIDDDNKCTKRLKSIKVIVTRGMNLDKPKQLKLINTYINGFHRKYRRDRRTRQETVFGEITVKQEWTTLTNFLSRGGDCEDYATSKYQLLRLMGYVDDNLRIVIVRDLRERAYHAVVAVRHEDQTVVLLDTDNRILRKRPFNYKYVYAINEASIWDHGIDQVTLPRSIRKQIEGKP